MHGLLVPFESLDTHSNKKLASLFFSARRVLNDRPIRLWIARYHQQISVPRLQTNVLVKKTPNCVGTASSTNIVRLPRRRADTARALVNVIATAAAHKSSAEWAIRHSFSRTCKLVPWLFERSRLAGKLLWSSQVNTLPKAKSKTRSKQNKDMHTCSSVYSGRGVPLPVLTSGGEWVGVRACKNASRVPLSLCDVTQTSDPADPPPCACRTSEASLKGFLDVLERALLHVRYSPCKWSTQQVTAKSVSFEKIIYFSVKWTVPVLMGLLIRTGYLYRSSWAF
jgi:hypothetical protein